MSTFPRKAWIFSPAFVVTEVTAIGYYHGWAGKQPEYTVVKKAAGTESVKDTTDVFYTYEQAHTAARAKIDKRRKALQATLLKLEKQENRLVISARPLKKLPQK